MAVDLKIEPSKEAISVLDRNLKHPENGTIISFEKFLEKSSKEPIRMFRNVFQLFYDMIYHYIEEEDRYKDDPESINYKTINSEKLFVLNTDTPFFADLPLANRLIRLADSFRDGAQQNKLYIFIGPPGSGKSTFLNNLLQKFQEFTYTKEGAMYEVLWRLDNRKLGTNLTLEIKDQQKNLYLNTKNKNKHEFSDYLEIPCPSHDHPILLIPKKHRAEVLETLISNPLRNKIFHKKEFQWIFKDSACTICSSIYNAIEAKLKSPVEIFDMIYAKKYYFNRRLGEGITVFNPADPPPKQNVLTNQEIQKELSRCA